MSTVEQMFVCEFINISLIKYCVDKTSLALAVLTNCIREAVRLASNKWKPVFTQVAVVGK